MAAVTRDRHIAGAGTAADAWPGDAGLASVAEAGVVDLVPPGALLVVVTPHPKDESLACGGLLQLLGARPDARTPLLVAVTNGEASHSGSADWPRERLRAVRPQETLAALACLGRAAVMLRLGIADGGVTAAEANWRAGLPRCSNPATWCSRLGATTAIPIMKPPRACLAAAAQHGARTLEAPIWGWHWSAPADGAMPLAHARKLPLPAAALARKRAAMACFHSQVLPDASRAAGRSRPRAGTRPPAFRTVFPRP